MNIVLITPTLGVGGGQRYITELANYWAKNGHKISLIVFRDEEIFYKISPKVVILKLNYSFSGKYSKINSGLKTMIGLRKNIKQIQPDFVLSIVSTTNLLTIVSTTFLNTKIFVRDVFSYTRKRSFLHRISRRYLYRKANDIIAQTNEIKEFIERETLNRNVKVIQNPVREFKLAKYSEKEKIILNIGALIPRKGQKYFIELCSKLKKSGWKYVILGEGELRKSLELQIDKLNCNEKIKLIGTVKNVDNWLIKSSIFVLTSSLEGLPNALIEAMSAGLACVSFDCDTGPRDLIEDGENGFLVPLNDMELIISKVEKLMNDIDLRDKFSKKAIKATDKFKVDKIANEVLNFCINS